LADFAIDGIHTEDGICGKLLRDEWRRRYGNRLRRRCHFTRNIALRYGSLLDRKNWNTRLAIQDI
jgi:hypothetical protein